MRIAATKYSDYIIITSENPRNENPIDIKILPDFLIQLQKHIENDL